MQYILNNSVNTLISRMPVRKETKIFLALLLVWFTINLFQALFMEILSDEAYYKLYSEYLDWGYFDHPPMVALMIKVSSLFFSGNLGVRFLTVLLQLFTLLLIWMTMENRESNNRKVYTFFIVSGSIFMFTGYGVITAPDAPLLFFTALFLYSFKKFIYLQKWSYTLLLAVAMAGLIYSKYQAVLVIGFAVLSNLILLKRFRFWIAGILALILIFPHFYWQYSHDFPSLQYHLVYRLENFKWKYVLEYLPNQFILMNPVTLGAAAFVLIKFPPLDHFNRCLYLQIIGFFVFFLFISFRDHVEPNWTIPCSISMIIILTERIGNNQALFKYSRRIIMPSLVLVITCRLLLMTNNDITRLIAYNGKKEKYKFIEKVAKDLPVVFIGSYQAPSLYHFFTGKEGIVLSSLF
jgi:4-amino-4-deoxy-L-arabinose transferase-like glycosyltransferase